MIEISRHGPMAFPQAGGVGGGGPGPHAAFRSQAMPGETNETDCLFGCQHIASE